MSKARKYIKPKAIAERSGAGKHDVEHGREYGGKHDRKYCREHIMEHVIEQ